MKTYPIRDDNGDLFAFEVDNLFLSGRSLSRILRTIDGVEWARPVRLYSGRGDLRVEFRYAGVEFVVEEPFGDNSRYWIGPRALNRPEPIRIAEIERALRAYRPRLLRWISERWPSRSD